MAVGKLYERGQLGQEEDCRGQGGFTVTVITNHILTGNDLPKSIES